MEQTASERERGNRGRWHKLVRRIHMYAGLVMLPWLLFFGVSGLLFNHPNVGEDVRAERVPSADLKSLSPWQPHAVAEQVLKSLNAQAGLRSPGPYHLDDSIEPTLAGSTVLSARAGDRAYMLLVDLAHARGLLVTRMARPRSADASFPHLKLDVPGYALSEVERSAEQLLRSRGKLANSSLQLHPKIGPELRFAATDARGTRWHLTFDPRSGELSGRKADAFPNVGLSIILAKMHTTHHFPLNMGALWLWALFEDLLGLSMVVWSITGMIMWWKMRPTRIIGLISIAAALGIAAFVMAGTLDQLFFGDVQQPMGPGE